MTPAVPAGEERPLTGGPAARRRGPLHLLITALLIAIPAGYGVVAAVQSYDSDGDKHAKAQTSGIIHGLPSRMQRGVYQVPVPYGATGTGYLEANSWQVSSLYVQFTTSAGGLDTFLAQYGTGRTVLRDGRVTVTNAEARRVGWDFTTGHHWSGADLTSHGTAPSHRITVNLDNPDRPRVYVVASADFR